MAKHAALLQDVFVCGVDLSVMVEVCAQAPLDVKDLHRDAVSRNDLSATGELQLELGLSGACRHQVLNFNRPHVDGRAACEVRERVCVAILHLLRQLKPPFADEPRYVVRNAPREIDTLVGGDPKPAPPLVLVSDVLPAGRGDGQVAGVKRGTGPLSVNCVCSVDGKRGAGLPADAAGQHGVRPVFPAAVLEEHQRAVQRVVRAVRAGHGLEARLAVEHRTACAEKTDVEVKEKVVPLALTVELRPRAGPRLGVSSFLADAERGRRAFADKRHGTLGASRIARPRAVGLHDDIGTRVAVEDAVELHVIRRGHSPGQVLDVLPVEIR